MLITSELCILAIWTDTPCSLLDPSISYICKSALIGTCHSEGTEFTNWHLLISQLLPSLGGIQLGR